MLLNSLYYFSVFGPVVSDKIFKQNAEFESQYCPPSPFEGADQKVEDNMTRPSVGGKTGHLTDEMESEYKRICEALFWTP